MVLNEQVLNKIRKSYKKNKKNDLIRNIVSQNNINNVTLNHKLVQKDHSFFNSKINEEHLIPSNQKQTGRCWLFAFLNKARALMMKKYNLEHFEFSQIYLTFWDKLEKSHTFLQYIQETKKKSLDNIYVKKLLDSPTMDGGQWNMIHHLIEKYGLCPKSVMKETYHSNNTDNLNNILNEKLIYFARQIREGHGNIDNMMSDIYRLLVYFLGEPPIEFNWEYKKKITKGGKTKKKGKRTRRKNLTFKHVKKTNFNKGLAVTNISPLDFYKYYVPIDVSKKICIIHNPARPYYKKYDIKYLKNVYEKGGTNYINLPLNVMKECLKKSIKNKEAVWFGCDISKSKSKKYHILHQNIHNIETLLNTPIELPKEKSLMYHQTSVNHAMLICGMNKTSNGTINKWLVENSHGMSKESDKFEENKDGTLFMYDNWFDNHVFEIVIDQEYTNSKIKKVLKQKPIVLDPWDPFGSCL